MSSTPTSSSAQTGNSQTVLEMLRFAAVHRLCVELGYGGTHRLVEPYSLRFSAEGDILLYARRAQSDDIRTYRVDRIESVRMTSVPFVPVFAVEMSAEGPLLIRPPSLPLSSKRSEKNAIPRDADPAVEERSTALSSS